MTNGKDSPTNNAEATASLPGGPSADASFKAALKQRGIGLTGGIGTGKSTVAAVIRACGLPVIDADELARSVTGPGTPGLAAVVGAFGPGVLSESQELNRRYLRERVFADKKQLATLEAITHPLIRAALWQRLGDLGLQASISPFFYEASLIFERGLAADLHSVWATYCPPAVQLARVMARDRVDAALAALVLANQLDAQVKAQKADVIINTDKSLAELQREVEARLAPLLKA